ncbi:MAG: MFS transporter, partial [Rhodospirillales bacterium]
MSEPSDTARPAGRAPSKAAVIGWCFYDWANSSFPTVITTFVFAAYFTKAVAADPIAGTEQWGYAISASALLV